MNARIINLRRWVTPSENALLLILAVVLGVISSIGVVIFRAGIDFFTVVYRVAGLHSLNGLGVLAIVPLLGAAGLIVGLLMDRLIGSERHHGVAGIIEVAAFAGGRLRYWRMPIKVTMEAFSLGAGASAGPEDPSVQIGSNFGSMLGQWLHLSDDRMRLLLAAGAASGIAAAFRAPIAGVFFALEIILGDFSTGAFGVVVLAAVVSAAVTQAIDPSGPELGIHSYTLTGLAELPFYALLGGLLAIISAGFIRFYYWQQEFWHHLKLWPPLKTGFAGVMVGLIAIFMPQIMGVGRDTLNSLLNGNATDYTVLFLLALAAAKTITTSISLGGGFVGGVFAPVLFVGAALGSAFGRITHDFLPRFLGADPAAYAMAGMAALMSGVIRSPITAVLLLFELTDDYRLILPLMLSTAVCLFIAERIAPDGIYQSALARKGVRLTSDKQTPLLQTVTVAQVMLTDPPRIAENAPAAMAAGMMVEHDTHGLLVVDEKGKLTGIVTLQDLAVARDSRNFDQATVVEICSLQPLSVTPEMSIADALRLMSARDLGRVPVVTVEDPGKIVGLLRRRDVMRAYDLAFTKQRDEMETLRRIIEAG